MGNFWSQETRNGRACPKDMRRNESWSSRYVVCVGWWMGVYDSHLILARLSQEAADRESKLLRDLSAANEKNLLLRSQV